MKKPLVQSFEPRVAVTNRFPGKETILKDSDYTLQFIIYTPTDL